LAAGVSSDEGTLIVYPLETEDDESEILTLLVFWDDVARDSLFVYSRALERRRDIGLALRHLERDLGIDSAAVARKHFLLDSRLSKAKNREGADDDDRWLAATEALIGSLIGCDDV
jgi:hypothetical protein